jgi:aerobic carbon-monoxide dehydrogenase medium subunit
VKPVKFDYARPRDLATAIDLAGRGGGVAKFIAGGQSIGPMLNLRLVQPDLLIDVTAIDELKRVEQTVDGLTIGGCITHADIEDGRVPDVTRGAMPSVAAGIAYRAVRNRGTIGGSLAHADPSADWISALAALGAQAVVRGAGGERSVAVEALMTGVFESTLAEGELLTGIRVAKLSPAARWGYFKSCRKTGELAHAIGAFLHDPARGVCRAVIGATGTKPLVFPDAAGLFAGRGPGHDLDRGAVIGAMTEFGIADPVERQIHFGCLRRAVAQAGRA